MGTEEAVRQPFAVDFSRVENLRSIKIHQAKQLSANTGVAVKGIFGATDDPTSHEETLREVAEQCHCSLDDLEDVYQCTALQEGMIALTFKDPMAYTIEYEYRLPSGIDPLRFQAAWDRTIQTNPVLRTRIVPTRRQGCVQAVLRGNVPWRVRADGLSTRTGSVWRVGAPLVQFTLTSDLDERYTLRVLIHHALCDDWSMTLLLHQVDAAYRGEELIYRPFRPLIEHIWKTRAKGDAFWTAEFQDAHLTDMKGFPPLPAPGFVPHPTQMRQHSISINPDQGDRFTVNTKMRLAWAVLQSLYTGSTDTLFGAVNAGRGVPIPGIETLSGPTLVCVPVRIALRPNDAVVDLLEAVQQHWVAAMEFEHVGLQNLLRLGPGPATACQFQTLMAVEPREAHSIPSLFAENRVVQKAYDTYSLILRCRPSTQTMTIEARFDPVVINPHQTERILHQLAQIYGQIDSVPALALRDINTLSTQDKLELNGWNQPVPSAASQRVHCLFHDRVLCQPQAPAVCSWDGDLTYETLDKLSFAAAVCLTRRGIEPGVFVPLCVEKSKWMAVAILGVMKAGGTFVLLDPSYPIQRLRQMCQQLRPKLIVTSQGHASVASQLIGDILSIDELNLEKLMNENDPSFFNASTVTSDDPIYVTFTSGSTGTPKGVLVHHDGFASSAMVHGKLYHFTPQSRVLQFASPAFDSCIIEHLSTLIMGGCVCIPTATDCHSCLGDAMNQFAVNVACLTPTVTRTLSPDSLLTLDSLVFVGETVLASDVARWEPYVHVRNAYGPAECSAVFSVQPDLQCQDPSNIGVPTGAVGWVVHPEDHGRLMPVGCMGELLIEGPIVGHGYLSSPRQSAEVFIKPPSWRRQFGISHGRMYKTGDLAQCVGDGTFRYLGRKDTQAKLHGQRMEVAEIEHYLQCSFPRAQQVVAEILRPQDLLVAFVYLPESFPSTISSSDQEALFSFPSDDFRTECCTAEVELSNALPPFMVPSVFLPVSRMPLTPSGKTNRRRLRECAASLSWDVLQTYRRTPSHPQRALTSREEMLQQIWAQALNRSPDQMGVTQSFFRLGGDSVSAMQVAASCRSAGFKVTVADIFRFSTIAELAKKMQESSNSYSLSSGPEDPTDTWFCLSPIQQLFFKHTPQGHNQFTQQFLLHVSRPKPASQIRQAIKAIVDQHSMLRACYRQRSDGQWEQAVRPKGRDDYLFREHSLPSFEAHDLRRTLIGSQEMLDIKQGTVMAADLITTTQKQYLSLMVHHLVIDLVSWRVLLQDLDEILTTGAVSGLPSISFQRWCHLQRAYSSEFLDPRMTLPTDIPSPFLDYWGSFATLSGNTWGETVQRSISLPEHITKAITGPSNDAFHTRPVEIIHTAILYAFVRTFDDRSEPTIFSEGHGREPWDGEIDISRTVGWFTTIAPLFVKAEKGQDVTELLQGVKAARRAIPSNGWAYFASRHLHPEGPRYCQSHAPIEILFNYTGLFQQLERSDALLQLASLPDHDMVPIPPDLPRFALIDVSATVMDGCLHLSFWYNRQMQYQDRLHQWVRECQQTLEQLAIILRQHQGFTMSDFPLLSLTRDDQLQRLTYQISSQCQVSPSEIEDIYPCSPVQLGMWLSQVKNPQMYWSHMQWSIHPLSSASAPVDLNKVKNAWQEVVNRHPILRTVFTGGIDQRSHPAQAVLKSVVADVEISPNAIMDGRSPSLSDQERTKKRPPHRLGLGVQPDGGIACKLTIHHMLMDGITRQVLLSDFHRAYDEQLPVAPGTPYSSYIAYIQGKDGTESETYWDNYLDGVHPCIFPSLGTVDVDTHAFHSVPLIFEFEHNLQYFCQHHGITVSNFFQVAWGLVLRVFTGSDSVCFGYLTSGREIPLRDAHGIAGPLINLLVCRLFLADEALIASTLVDNQAAYARSLDHQHRALTDVIHSLDLSGQVLFNTAVSLQRENADRTSNDSSNIKLDYGGGYDPTEYNLTVNVLIGEKSIHGDLTYWAQAVSDVQAELISDAFQHAVMQLLDPANVYLGQIDLFGPKNKRQLLKLNEHSPAPVMSCIHRNIHQYSLTHPTASAVCAWDGKFTYEELDIASSSLAQHLNQHGVGPEVFVPVLSDKSRWAVVAVLAVLKAGGAFILLDPSHPLERLQDMVHQNFDCPLILASKHRMGQAANVVEKVIAIDGDGDEQEWHSLEIVPSMLTSPTMAAYAVFTSGSTGKAKASIMEHRSFLSAAEVHHRMLHLGDHSRVLQFSSYAFDASIVEILTTLLVGGCVCIPSDTDRQQRLWHIIQELQVNWTLLTPSVARILDPQHIPCLKTLVLGGEGMSGNDVRQWTPYVHLINAYGPSECSVIATVQECSKSLLMDPADIGRPAGGVNWVVHPHDPDRLTPIGAVGELLIEGPIVGRGYVNRSGHMAAAFLEYPSWLQQIRSSQTGLLYKTGDLVRLLPDGSARYLGRKDRQVKLYGQRIELAEVEYHVQQFFPGTPDVFAEIVTPKNSDSAYLVASVNISQAGQDTTNFETAVGETRARLQAELPAFLIPTAFVPLHQVPRMLNGKVDRRRLRRDASQALQVQIHLSERGLKKAPNIDLSPTEHKMRILWSKVLRRAAETIRLDDNFFRLGGDSIAVMKLASSASVEGLQLTVAEVFLHPRLRDLARIHTSHQQGQSSPFDCGAGEDMPPFALLPPKQHTEAQSQAMIQCGISMDHIEDIYPCTALQAGLAAITAERPGAYVAQHHYRLPWDIDLDRLRDAWERVSATHPILRTRLIQTVDLGCLQVVIRDEKPLWRVVSSNQEDEPEQEMLFGQRLVQLDTIPPSLNDPDIRDCYLRLTMHHAVYDDLSLSRLIACVRSAYHADDRKLAKPVPFQRFIQYANSQLEPALDRWRAEFQNLSALPFPTLPSPCYRPRALTHAQCTVHTGPFTDYSVTRSTATWLSWALTQSQYQSNQEVFFGVISTGRRAPVRGIETMSGPTIATLPLRVVLNPNTTVAQALEDLQARSVQMIPLEQVGLQRIAKLGPEAMQACSFQTLLNVEVPEAHGDHNYIDLMQRIDTTAGPGTFSTYAVQLVCTLNIEDVVIQATFDEHVVPQWQMQCILDQFSHILQLVYQKPQCLVRDIPTLNPRSIQQLKSWNPEASPLIPTTVSEMIHQRYTTLSFAPAVCAWDGSFSYQDLQSFSSKLVTLLLAHDIGSKSVIPIYMERSRWTVVAILGVLQTGSTFALLDTSYPLSRLQAICLHIQAPVILTAVENVPTAQKLVPTVITVGTDTGLSQLVGTDHSQSCVDPHQAMYTVFTSGSTGEPKGVVIENGAFVTMALPYARQMGLDHTSRVLHSASYAFDVSIGEILGTLIVGGCICILSESESRDGLAHAVARMQPSHANFTPSLLRALTPSDLPSVHTIGLVGEPARTSDIQQWADQVHLVNCYGPAECTVCFTMQPSIHRNSPATNIGFPIAGNAWIAHPRDPHQPVPIGAVGELLLQGPLVGRGYLNNIDQTAVAFIHCPRWIQQLSSGHDMSATRVYRTGDLVRYEADGSFFFVGRRDFQAKLRGQRFELGEVEENIQRYFPGVLRDVIAEISTPAGPRKTPCLIAFIVSDEPNQVDTTAMPSSSPCAQLPLDSVAPPGFEARIATVKIRLRDALPDYMLPSAYVPLRQMPRTTSGKVDRRRLRDAATAVTLQQLEFLASNSTNKQVMATQAEWMLQGIWARTLGIPPAQVGADDSFFRLGGDSISALHATSLSRANGIEHSVADLVRWKSIRELAKRFSVSPSPVPMPMTSNTGENRLPESNVLAVYPCTPSQRAILLNQMQDPVSYASQLMWRVDTSSSQDHPEVNVHRLAKAWQRVITRHPALRTIFRPDKSDSDFFEQVLLKQIEPPVAVLPEPVDKDPQFHPIVTRHGQIPHHLTVYTTTSGQVMCRLDINHSIIDAISVAFVERDLCRAYNGSPLSDHGDTYPKYLSLVQQQPQEPARAYWVSYLAGISPSDLPASRTTTAVNDSSNSLQKLDIVLTHRGSDIECFSRWTDWTASNVLYFAWALTLSSFTGTDEVCFGTLTSGRDWPIPHLGDAVGQFSNMSVCRVHLYPQTTLDQAALCLQEHYGHVLSHQTFPLAQIARVAGVTIRELASTAVNVQYALPADSSIDEESLLRLTPVNGQDPTLQDIILYALMEQNGELQVSMSYRPSRISSHLASQLAEYFDLAVSTILRHPHAVLHDLHLLSITDELRLRCWNQPLPNPARACVHEVIEHRTMGQPDHMAVSGWDGVFTYRELDQVSSQLAGSLIARGCTAGQCIPVCFEKSRWTIVAILAVMKAGGTFVPLDHTHPLTRLQDICRRTHATLILSSVAQFPLSQCLSNEIIIVSSRVFTTDDHSVVLSGHRRVDPDQAAYILFTSGTTGTPKGVMIPHSSYSYAAETHIRAFSLHPQSRVLQFSSYAFDVSVMEILTTLMAGATVCIISEQECSQMLLQGTCPVAVTHAFLTPSIAGAMDASQASWVQTLVLLGEPVSTSHITQWHGACNLINGYGSTECSVINTVRPGLTPDFDPGNIGWPMGIHCWVVDKDDHDKLLPVGTVGELLLSGPSVGQGYLDQLDKTAERFLEPPQWLRNLYPEAPPSRRLYKTGDLVRYVIADGSLRFEGRKDRQIKIRGHRVELEDIEYHTRRCFPGAKEAVVDQVVVPEGLSSASTTFASARRLVACIWGEPDNQTAATNAVTENNGCAQGLLSAPSRGFHADAAAALVQLREVLPGYMIPDLFLPIVKVPRTKSGKTDRRRLREHISAIKPERWDAYSAVQRRKQSMETETEIKLHSILIRLLNVSPDAIGAEDSFFHLGGDSILAMKVAANAGAEGLEISAHNILRYPTIRHWAQIVDEAHMPSSGAPKAYTPFSLITDDDHAAIVTPYFSGEHPFTPDNVDDILPAVGPQAYYITDSSLVSHAFLFPAALAIDRLRWACSQVLSHYSILRTLFVSLDERIFQVILRETDPVFDLVEDEDPEAYMAQLSQQEIVPITPQGSILVHFTVVTSPVRLDWVFIVRISHAQFDGSCLGMLWEAIAAAYTGRELPTAVDFTNMVHHRLGHDHTDAFAFWRQYLQDTCLAALDPLNITHYPGPLKDTPPRNVRREITRPRLLPEVTLANLVKAALSWLLSQHSSQLDIILGQVVHGRGGSLPDIDKVFGPCANILPMRITIDLSWTVADLLRHVQAQQLATTPYDFMSLPEIAKQSTSWPENAKFGLLVHHQALQSHSCWEIGGVASSSSASWGKSRLIPGQVGVFSIERERGLDLFIAAPVDALSQPAAELLADKLSETIGLFSRCLNSPLTALDKEGDTLTKTRPGSSHLLQN